MKKMGKGEIKEEEEIGDIGVRLKIEDLRGIEWILKGGNMEEKGWDMMVKKLKMIKRKGDKMILRIKDMRKLEREFLRRGKREDELVKKDLKERELDLEGGKRGMKIGNSVMNIMRIDEIKREKMSKLMNMDVEERKKDIIVVEIEDEKELRKKEKSKKKNDRKKKSSKRIEKKRKVIDMNMCEEVEGKRNGKLIRIVGKLGNVMKIENGFGKKVERVEDGILKIGMIIKKVKNNMMLVENDFKEEMNELGKIGKWWGG